MSSITIFKLEDFIDVFEDHTIKVKSKKNDAVSSFSNEFSYAQIPHHKVTVYNECGVTVTLYDGSDKNGISRGDVVNEKTITVPITQGQIYANQTWATTPNGITLYNQTTGKSGNPVTISSDSTLKVIERRSKT